MRAIVFFEHGGPEVLQYLKDLPEPEPAAGEVLVRVEFAALNRLDDFVRTGWRGLQLAFPHVLGADFCGRIASLGAGVTGWREGQRVVANPTLWCGRCPQCLAGFQNRCDSFTIIGEGRAGAYAELVRVPSRNLLAVPDGYPAERAAAAPLVSVTAWHMLVIAGRLRPGESVLVVGAGGGVNHLAIQIARLAGARVYAVANGIAKAELARGLGAEWVVDRTAEPDWSKAVWQATGRRGVDVVVDNVGAASWRDSLRCLAKGGRLLTVGGSTGYDAATPVNALFGRHLSIIGSTMGTQADFDTAMRLVFAGQLQPVIDRVYLLDAYPEALERMLGGEGFGKVVLRV